MKLLVIESHLGEGIFPCFKEGTIVDNLADCLNTPHWCSGTINGYATYIPETYLDNGCLNRDYNPTELVVEEGQTVTLLKVVFEWLYVIDSNNNEGWLPASKVVSI